MAVKNAAWLCLSHLLVDLARHAHKRAGAAAATALANARAVYYICRVHAAICGYKRHRAIDLGSQEPLLLSVNCAFLSSYADFISSTSLTTRSEAPSVSSPGMANMAVLPAMAAFGCDQSRLQKLKHVGLDEIAAAQQLAPSSPAPATPISFEPSPRDQAAEAASRSSLPPSPTVLVNQVHSASAVQSPVVSAFLHVDSKRTFSCATVDCPPPAPFHKQKRAKIGADSVGRGGSGASPTDSECESYEVDHVSPGTAAAATAGMSTGAAAAALNKRTSRVGTMQPRALFTVFM
jgi:hypothetical protein